MKRLFNSIFLISGTAIGAGLMALPLTAINIGTVAILLIVMCMSFLAYTSSIMTVNLNIKRGTKQSIMELSKDISGNKMYCVTSLSFYILSFSLLTVYFSGVASLLSAFFQLNDSLIILICGILLFLMLSLNINTFSRLNTILVLMLLAFIAIALSKINIFNSSSNVMPLGQPREILAFAPIIFTSFGVQNICHHISGYLENDSKKIKLAFFIGIIIPAIIYVVWIMSVFQNIQVSDLSFYQKLQNHQVSVGELIGFLCKTSGSVYIEILLKILTLFAVITSAIGIAIGLKTPIREITKTSNTTSNLIIASIPVVFAVFIPNAFINILSFGGMIAIIFVIFVPFLLTMKSEKLKLNHIVCLLMGIIIVLCEILNMLKV